MELRIKEIAKKKGKTLHQIADEMGIIYNALYQRLSVSPKLSTLEEIAKILDCDPMELVEPKATHQHFYDDKTGEWLGIRKK